MSSCDTREAGAAATVGGRRISVADVQDAYQDIVPLVGQDQQITQGQILNLIILAPYLDQAAAAAGHGVSEQDAKLDMKSAGAKAAKPTSAGLEVWRANLAATALQNSGTPTAKLQVIYQGIGVKLRKARVHINPRYGARIDYSTFSIVPSTTNWLVTPAPTAQATPGATSSP